jgi:hypothetical protein
MTSLGAPARRIFISAAMGADVSSVRELVEAAGMEATSWEALPPATTLARAIGSEIERCDGLIAIVGENGVAASVMFEVGVALGLTKPVVLVAPDRDAPSAIPSVLAGLPVILMGGDVGATSSRLADALAQPTNSGADVTSPPRGERIQLFVSEVATRGWADESEREVAEALAHLGARVVAQSPPNTRDFVDMAVWIDGAPVREINPVMVEVAGRGAREPDKIAQLREYLQASQTIIGLLVMREDREPRWDIHAGTAIAIVGIDWLRSATGRDFIRLLTYGRNSWAHGSP